MVSLFFISVLHVTHTHCSIDGIHKILVATSEGRLLVASIDPREGGECRVHKEYRSAGLFSFPPSLPPSLPPLPPSLHSSLHPSLSNVIIIVEH